MNKGNLKFFAIILVLFLSACSHAAYIEKKYKGKQINPKYFKQLNDSGHHRWNLESFCIEYDYSTDNESKTITFEGKFTYILPLEKRKYISEQALLEYEYFTIIPLFADSSGKVISIESAKIKPGKFLVDPFKFKAIIS